MYCRPCVQVVIIKFNNDSKSQDHKNCDTKKAWEHEQEIQINIIYKCYNLDRKKTAMYKTQDCILSDIHWRSEHYSPHTPICDKNIIPKKAVTL